MPDFEALIRHQQLKQPTTNQRLKVVDSPNFEKGEKEEKEKNEETIIKQSGLLINFFGGFIGSVIGTLTILFLYINEYLPLDLLKLK
ncbi:hypothetical protein HA150_00300 [Prochlorococcus marinus XMU1414]|uniref:hypothetical protein n=1 Tax=Prochlorococcus marinus TaxID=1219 RepID=UPI001ADADFF0|nr:hypothetical protein [Prochlorococcus marinus]MBO8227339.1 hypothetical protein [Prochlorococcus marinus XMU1414]MBW3044854.1 hypothetical protein [Prochlorococcus marinus str. MU1414]MCR8536585.1 hypothetical protein [Prochlorococcus marinus XMU1424]